MAQKSEILAIILIVVLVSVFAFYANRDPASLGKAFQQPEFSPLLKNLDPYSNSDLMPSKEQSELSEEDIESPVKLELFVITKKSGEKIIKALITSEIEGKAELIWDTPGPKIRNSVAYLKGNELIAKEIRLPKGTSARITARLKLIDQDGHEFNEFAAADVGIAKVQSQFKKDSTGKNVIEYEGKGRENKGRVTK